MSMKILLAAALAFAVSVPAGTVAFADTTVVPCVGCAISATQNEIQSQINQQIIRSSVQGAINSQLQTQSAAQQLQTVCA